MYAGIQDTASSSPLSPEQRALLANWGGDDRARYAIHGLRIEVGAGVTPERLRAIVEQVLCEHAILGTALRHVAGYRGLRLQVTGATAPLAWQTVDGADLADISRKPLDVENGELLRAVLVTDGGAHWTLSLTVSALIADSGSLVSLVERIAEACAGEMGPKQVFQYAQYVDWRRELEADVNATAERNYWQRYLSGVDAWVSPRLSYRREGARMPGAAHVRVTERLAPALMARLAGTAYAGVQAEVMLQTVWWVLLARLTGFNPYAAGWQHDCRRDYDLMRGAVGVFEKVLPLIIEGRSDEPFSTWLARMTECAGAHVDAQEFCPIETLSAGAHLAVGFAFQDAPSLAGPTPLRVMELSGPMPGFELALQIVASPEGSELAVYADATLYPPLAVERLLAQYLTLLQSALARPDCAVSELPWMSEAEWRALQSNWRGADIDFGPGSIAQRVAQWAQATPDATALVAGTQRLNYAALDARANRLAHWMLARGVEAGALVALELPRSPDLIVAMLAAWKIGAGYLPMEPDWPALRRDAVLTDARPALVLCEGKRHEARSWLEVVMGGVDLEGYAAEPPAHKYGADDIAYVLYTSGSTGRPKGVVIEQRQLLNYVAAASDAMDLGSCRRWALATSVAADLGNTALFGALFNGACLVLAGEKEARDAEAFSRFMADFAIDALKIVPSHLEALMECDAPRLPRTLVLGGEAAPRALIERLARLNPDCIVYNHYGPTETTVGVMVHRVDHGESAPDVLPLTCVLANNRVYVLDAAQQPVPSGGLGELYVGGAQLCRGYLNREQEGVFVADPWQPGQRLYRTGDLARSLPTGGVRLAGRADHQVKIRGYRVEPGEVEAVLLGVPEVRQAAVISRDGATGPELIAFIVGGEVDALGIPVCREALAKVLPDYMLPAGYVFLDEFPRLHNGKIDRLTLAAMKAPVQALDSGAAPSGALEAALAESMAVLLGRERLAADADFFESGGHSLLVIRLVARIRKLLHIEIEPGLVFDHPTAQALAAALCALHEPTTLDERIRGHGAQA